MWFWIWIFLQVKFIKIIIPSVKNIFFSPVFHLDLLITDQIVILMPFVFVYISLNLIHVNYLSDYLPQPYRYNVFFSPFFQNYILIIILLFNLFYLLDFNKSVNMYFCNAHWYSSMQKSYAISIFVEHPINNSQIRNKNFYRNPEKLPVQGKQPMNYMV